MFRTILSACFITLLFAGLAFGHAPKKIEAEFNLDDHVLTVTVYHQVKDAAKHFVEEISVELNGKDIIEQELFAQETPEEQTVLYRITDAGPGDKITISAECSMAGEKEVTIKVKEAKKEKKKETKEN